MNDLNEQMLFTTLDIVQDRNSSKCRKETAKQLDDFLSAMRSVRLELSSCLNKIWGNYKLMVVPHPDGDGDLLLSGAKDVLPFVEDREKFEAVLASYITGIRTVEGIIFEGAYVQACCLIRQELEALTQMRHIMNGTSKAKKAPNIKVLEKHHKLIYSELTGVAHLSHHEDLSSMAKGSSFAQDLLISPLQFNFISEFDSSLSKNLFAIHYSVIIEVLLCLDEYFSKYIPTVELGLESQENLFNAHNKLVELVPKLEFPNKAYKSKDSNAASCVN